MTQGNSQQGAPMRNKRDFANIFRAAEMPKGPKLIGLEGEHLSLRPDGTPALWTMVERMFRTLAREHGYTPDPDPQGNIVALKKDNKAGFSASWSPEPGNQVEYSGAPYDNVHDIVADLETAQRAGVAAADEAGFRLVTMGFLPAKIAPLDVPRRPGARYETMRRHSAEVESDDPPLPGLYNRGHGMMHKSATTQENVNYRSEADAGRKARAMANIAWPVSGAFNNSGYLGGRRANAQSVRNVNNRNSMGGRTGTRLRAVFAKGAGGLYTRVADHYTDEMPMLGLYDTNRNFIDRAGQSFAAYLASGMATTTDAANHVKSAFYGDLRVQPGVIEGRAKDSVPLEMKKSMAALYFGLMHNEDALDAVLDRTSRMTEADRDRLHERVPYLGLQTRFTGTDTVQDFNLELISIAHTALKERKLGEEAYLQPLEDLVRSGRNWAQRLEETFKDDWRSAAAVMDAAVNDGKGISVGDALVAPAQGRITVDMGRGLRR